MARSTRGETLDYHMALPYPVRLKKLSDPSEGETWLAEIPDLPGCMSHGSSPDDAVSSVEDAKELWISARLEDGYGVPEPSSDEYSGKFLLRVPKALHKTLSHQAEEQGVSLNQLVVYLLSRSAEGINVAAVQGTKEDRGINLQSAS